MKSAVIRFLDASDMQVKNAVRLSSVYIYISKNRLAKS